MKIHVPSRGIGILMDAPNSPEALKDLISTLTTGAFYAEREGYGDDARFMPVKPVAVTLLDDSSVGPITPELQSAKEEIAKWLKAWSEKNDLCNKLTAQLKAAGITPATD